MDKDEVYLGNCLVFGRQKKEFEKLKERIYIRLEGWKNKMLSRVGKPTLIKAVVQAIPTYSMSIFKIPKGVCEEMDVITRRFWWGVKSGKHNYLALKAWKDICKPKEVGGLGFLRFTDFNTTLLAKLGWKLAFGEETLWTSIFKAKYLRGT